MHASLNYTQTHTHADSIQYTPSITQLITRIILQNLIDFGIYVAMVLGHALLPSAGTSVSLHC